MPSTNRIMNTNYHTHMYLCRHAIGNVEDYCVKAVSLGFKHLGMSDHAPFKELKDRSVRMNPEDLDIYLEECITAKKKHENEIKLFIGLEIEFFHHHDKMYQNYLSKIDYLALGQHYIEDPTAKNGLRSSYALSRTEHLEKYVDMVIEAMKTNYFKFICHPDLFLYQVKEFESIHFQLSKKLIDAAIKYDVPLEINANGIRKGLIETNQGQRYLYPRKEFWEIAKQKKAKIIISSDAHKPEYLYDDAIEKAYQFAYDLGIKVEEELSF